MGVERDIAKKRLENEPLSGRSPRHAAVPSGIDPDASRVGVDGFDEPGEGDDDEDEESL